MHGIILLREEQKIPTELHCVLLFQTQSWTFPEIYLFLGNHLFIVHVIHINGAVAENILNFKFTIVTWRASRKLTSVPGYWWTVSAVPQKAYSSATLYGNCAASDCTRSQIDTQWPTIQNIYHKNKGRMPSSLWTVSSPAIWQALQEPSLQHQHLLWGCDPAEPHITALTLPCSSLYSLPFYLHCSLLHRLNFHVVQITIMYIVHLLSLLDKQPLYRVLCKSLSKSLVQLILIDWVKNIF